MVDSEGPILTLPDDLIGVLFSVSPSPCLFPCLQVCKKWNKLAFKNWQNLVLEPSEPYLKSAKMLPRLQHLSIRFCPVGAVDQLLQDVQNLPRSLSRLSCPLKWFPFFPNLPNLVYLEFWYDSESFKAPVVPDLDEYWTKLFSKVPNLRQLIGCIPTDKGLHVLTQLEEIMILSGPRTIPLAMQARIIRQLPNLKVFSMHNTYLNDMYYNDNDQFFKEISSNAYTLREQGLILSTRLMTTDPITAFTMLGQAFRTGDDSIVTSILQHPGFTIDQNFNPIQKNGKTILASYIVIEPEAHASCKMIVDYLVEKKRLDCLRMVRYDRHYSFLGRLVAAGFYDLATRLLEECEVPLNIGLHENAALCEVIERISKYRNQNDLPFYKYIMSKGALFDLYSIKASAEIGTKFFKSILPIAIKQEETPGSFKFILHGLIKLGKSSFIDIYETVLGHPADFESRNTYGSTPLGMAAFGICPFKCFSYVLNRSNPSNLDATNLLGHSPLFKICEDFTWTRRHVRKLRLLISRGARWDLAFDLETGTTAKVKLARALRNFSSAPKFEDFLKNFVYASDSEFEASLQLAFPKQVLSLEEMILGDDPPPPDIEPDSTPMVQVD